MKIRMYVPFISTRCHIFFPSTDAPVPFSPPPIIPIISSDTLLTGSRRHYAKEGIKIGTRRSAGKNFSGRVQGTRSWLLIENSETKHRVSGSHEIRIHGWPRAWTMTMTSCREHRWREKGAGASMAGKSGGSIGGRGKKWNRVDMNGVYIRISRPFSLAPKFPPICSRLAPTVPPPFPANFSRQRCSSRILPPPFPADC